MPKRSRYNTPSLVEKAASILAVESGKTKFEVAKEESILHKVNSGHKDRKRVRGPANPDVDECVLYGLNSRVIRMSL